MRPFGRSALDFQFYGNYAEDRIVNMCGWASEKAYGAAVNLFALISAYR